METERSATWIEEIGDKLTMILKMLADGSGGRIVFSDDGETSIVRGRAVIGRSVEAYLRLLRRIDAIELYYMFLEEVFASTKAQVNKGTYHDALMIMDKLGTEELRLLGAETGPWEKEIQRLNS